MWVQSIDHDVDNAVQLNERAVVLFGVVHIVQLNLATGWLRRG